VYAPPAGGPITSQANTAYYVVSQETNGLDYWYDHRTLTTTTDAPVNNSVHLSSGSWIALDGPNTSYVPPNFQYSLLGVPPGAVQVTVKASVAGPSFSVDGTSRRAFASASLCLARIYEPWQNYSGIGRWRWSCAMPISPRTSSWKPCDGWNHFMVRIQSIRSLVS
jgi:hypothetical protein